MKVLQNTIFPERAMLGSNQRPLPCEGSRVFTIGYRCLRKTAANGLNWARMHRILLRRMPSLYARVAARLLHNYQGWKASQHIKFALRADKHALMFRRYLAILAPPHPRYFRDQDNALDVGV
jgi:hypothetical protein